MSTREAQAMKSTFQTEQLVNLKLQNVAKEMCYVKKHSNF